jgi:poly-gamma-glutamate capsule biosynthesis protein CapA/YwtB (metallophosphatase superfamily)
VTDEAEADEANDEANKPNEAGEAEVNEAVKIKANEADMAIEANWAYEFDDLNKANKAVAAVASDVANAVDEANLADKARVTDKAEANRVIVFVKSPVMHPFSLTKCNAIFVEVKGCFGIFNNQLKCVPNGLNNQLK